MKKKSKYIRILTTIIIFIIIGFLVRKETHEQPAYDVIWKIYYPIFTVFGGIAVIVTITWLFKLGIQPRVKKVEKNIDSTIPVDKPKNTSWLKFVPIILVWIVFTISIMELHPKLWSIWYENEDWGLPIFWISQAMFIFLLLLLFRNFHKIFFIFIIILTGISLWYGFSERLAKEGMIKENKQVVLSTIQKKWRMCWGETNITMKHLGSVRAPCLKNSKQTLLLVSIKEYNSVRFVFSVSWKEHGIFKERSVFYWDKIKSKYGTWSRDGSKRKDSGKWDLKRENNNLFIGWITSNSDGSMHPLTLHVL